MMLLLASLPNAAPLACSLGQLSDQDEALMVAGNWLVAFATELWLQLCVTQNSTCCQRHGHDGIPTPQLLWIAHGCCCDCCRPLLTGARE